MRVAVAGGTGTVGRHAVQALISEGHEPVVLARSHGVNVVTGEGLDDALMGVAAVIDASNVITTQRKKSVAFFTASTQHLLEAGHRAGVTHHVALSIVGIDRVDYGYYEGKRRQEELVLTGPVPGTVLRATQFHEFAGQVLAGTKGPLALVPTMRIQPVAAREVGKGLAVLAVGPAAGMTDELAGPEEHDLVELARRVIAARRLRRRVIGVRFPGAAGRGMASGGLLPQSAGPRGTQTFEQWLAASGTLSP